MDDNRNDDASRIKDEITPAMARAGADEASSFDSRYETWEDLAVRVYVAMEMAKVSRFPHDRHKLGRLPHCFGGSFRIIADIVMQ